MYIIEQGLDMQHFIIQKMVKTLAVFAKPMDEIELVLQFLAQPFLYISNRYRPKACFQLFFADQGSTSQFAVPYPTNGKPIIFQENNIDVIFNRHPDGLRRKRNPLSHPNAFDLVCSNMMLFHHAVLLDPNFKKLILDVQVSAIGVEVDLHIQLIFKTVPKPLAVDLPKPMWSGNKTLVLKTPVKPDIVVFLN